MSVFCHPFFCCVPSESNEFRFVLGARRNYCCVYVNVAWVLPVNPGPEDSLPARS